MDRKAEEGAGAERRRLTTTRRDMAGGGSGPWHRPDRGTGGADLASGPPGRPGPRVRTAGCVLLLGHLLVVGWVTLRPLDVTWVTAANLRPLAGIRADLALGTTGAVRRIGEGLLLLAPLGILLPMAGGRIAVSPWASLARTVTAGALISLAIELLQTNVPGQVVDVDSLLLNTAGVAFAHLAVVPAGRAGLRRRRLRTVRTARQPDDGKDVAGWGAVPQSRSAGSQGATPTISRVGVAP